MPASLRHAAVLVACCVLLAAGCGGADGPGRRQASAEPAPPPPREEANGGERETPLASVVGSLVMTKLAGPTASREELEAIRSLRVGGVILFGPNVVDAAQVRALVGSLDDARRRAATRAGLEPGMLVSVDQEGGPIRNVPFAPPEETQPTLAGAGVARTRAAARATGEALRAVGISMDLGPVADLAEGPARTMAGRAFGSDPARVAPLVRTSVEGLQDGGVAATAKHFPGFGAATANSDEAVAYVDRDASELGAVDLAPFRAAVAGGVEVVMVSHGIHRALGSTRPGIIDPRVAMTLLRDELGFEGVAMTDSMNAKGFREAWGDTVPRACPAAVGAGIDLLLLTGTIETALLCRERILEAVERGTLDEARVREAAARVDALRGRVAIGASPSVD